MGGVRFCPFCFHVHISIKAKIQRVSEPSQPLLYFDTGPHMHVCIAQLYKIYHNSRSTSPSHPAHRLLPNSWCNRSKVQSLYIKKITLFEHFRITHDTLSFVKSRSYSPHILVGRKGQNCYSDSKSINHRATKQPNIWRGWWSLSSKSQLRGDLWVLNGICST